MFTLLINKFFLENNDLCSAKINHSEQENYYHFFLFNGHWDIHGKNCLFFSLHKLWNFVNCYYVFNFCLWLLFETDLKRELNFNDIFLDICYRERWLSYGIDERKVFSKEEKILIITFKNSALGYYWSYLKT